MCHGLVETRSDYCSQLESGGSIHLFLLRQEAYRSNRRRYISGFRSGCRDCSIRLPAPARNYAERVAFHGKYFFGTLHFYR